MPFCTKIIIEPELLLSLYYGNDLRPTELMKIFSCSSYTIFRLLKKYNIPTKGNGGGTWTDEQRNKLMKHLKGRVPWNKGLTKETDIRLKESGLKQSETKSKMVDKPWKIGHPCTEETKLIISQKNKGNVPPNKGIPCPEWQKELLHNVHKGKHYSPNTEFKKGQMSLENHPAWKGGISKEEYTKDFNLELKELIRDRDNRTCQECGIQESELNEKLSIHHIDYNKKNNSEDNLISLCRKCHSKTQFKRKHWKEYYKQKLKYMV